IAEAADKFESRLERLNDSKQSEELSAIVARLRDIAWRLSKDALGNIQRVQGLVHGANAPNIKRLFELYRLNILLNNLARLEVRGRDSGGLATVVTLSDGDFKSFQEQAITGPLQGEWDRRRAIEDFRHQSIVVARDEDGQVSIGFAHKEAKEIGALGANITALRSSIQADSFLASALSFENGETTVIGHNRWASNGVINQANCHPLTNELVKKSKEAVLSRLLVGALNGDIDNYPNLLTRLHSKAVGKVSSGITTDAKIIPVEIDRRLDEDGSGSNLGEAFQGAVREFEGSYAIAAHCSTAPGRVYLAQRGSGQGLFVGLTPDGGALFASELYGVVELCHEYIKLEGVGETEEEIGEIVILDNGAAPEIFSFTGQRQDNFDARRLHAKITTRDINKAEFEHYLLKEISEASRSVRKTLRGRLVVSGTEAPPVLSLDKSVIPESIAKTIESGKLRRVFVIGQGTASIAAGAIADYMASLLRKKDIPVLGLKATELSGFHLDSLDAQTLIIAVSQSGTTTDTNRTVDLAREAGAQVIGIVNRRGSDLAFKSDGVLYTSDGRDIEMSVASTKAFYCQVVAGYLLAVEFATRLKAVPASELESFLRELGDLPRRMDEVMEQRDVIRGIARAQAGKRRYWAVVGSGPGRFAAEEIRIKLSELCYKSMSADTIEDKKHIDLSAEAMIFVCAAGLSGTTAADAVKEIGIFKAHTALPIVVCDRGETRFAPYATAVIEVPVSSPRIALLLNTLAGHLFGYYAALSLDSGALVLKRIREFVEATVSELEADIQRDEGLGLDIYRRFRERVAPLARGVLTDLFEGRFNSGLPAHLAFQVGDALRLCLGQLSFDAVVSYNHGTDRLKQLHIVLSSLSLAIDHLKRPIDAIKHQAKTVTVGISREQAAMPLDGHLYKALAEAGVSAERLDEATASTLAAFDPMVSDVLGATIYDVEGLSPLGLPTARSKIRTLKKTGCSKDMVSRVDNGGPLSGTKRKVVSAPRVHIGLGAVDGRTLVITPLFDEGLITGLGLLHVLFREDLSTRDRVQSLRIAGRYEDVRAMVTESNPAWNDALLETVSVHELLGLDPVRLSQRLMAETR
ncbi:MAG: SIS domain-containing protein, partial [Planctomycetota bacterium]|nr:SIS domain-containing protein [Planctomycetota bacterium]